MPADFLGLAGKAVLVMGVANRKSVAFHTGKVLRAAGAKVLWSCHSEARRDELRKKLIPDEPLFVCDVEKQEQIDRLAAEVAAEVGQLHGFVHSLAFANYSQGAVPFHQTVREDFLQAVNVSCFSLIATANALAPHFAPDASVVTIGISTTTMAAENYGYMAPVKAALDSAVVFLARSFAGKARVNAVRPGLLKTQSSAGIPNYVPAYLYAEQATLRKRALQTEEVANTVAFLLSPASSGINAQGLVLDAGMACNYFDPTIVERVTRLD
ncbi:MAG: SDR family oxidoreductase [Planctomycetes bacterium]|nr:SDR family oxidoreductase [Planctomycetota bacterium]